MLNLSFSTLCLESHKRVPAPWSYKPLTSTCRASALSLLGMTFHHFGTLAASRKGRPAVSLACAYVCLCTDAQLKTLIVCRLLLSSKVYESKNWCAESESKQALFLSSQSHLIIFVLSNSRVLRLSSQAPRKMHTSQVSTASCQNLDLWALHHHVCMYMWDSYKCTVPFLSVFSS